MYFISSGSNKSETKQYKKALFIKTVLYFVNLLMSYETITVDNKLRKKLLKNLGKKIPEIKNEELYGKLLSFKGKVGLAESKTDADKELNKYFDKLLPKTAGGLWHELLVFVFLLRKDIGYILPLLLHQKFFSGYDILVPPDFLVITKEKDIYRIEVGIKKEIQSGSFSIITNIPTATIDTINSRCSDRCPICNKWILFCEKVINEFGDFSKEIGNKNEIKCLEECNIYKKKEILKGKCPYSKYSRNKTQKITHKYADGLHYHYSCVLENLSSRQRKKLIELQDSTAIKTHYPHYNGIEMLFKK